MNDRMTRQIIVNSAALLLAGALVGCQTAKVKEPLTSTLGGNDPQQQIEFFHQLGDRPVTSNDEAFHALLLFTDGEDPAKDYPGRLEALRQKGMLSAKFDRPAEEAVARGTLAVALAKALKIKGGIMLRVTGLFGPSPRYATRELQFAGVYPPSSPNQAFSGAEFLGIMAKAEEFTKSGTRGSGTVETEAEHGGGSIGKVTSGPPPADPATRPIVP